MESSFEFTHDRLRVYQLALEFLAAVAEFVGSLPRGESEIRDQLKRAADSVLLNTAEGAAILDVFAIRTLAPSESVERARGILHQIVSILTVLARSARSRAG